MVGVGVGGVVGVGVGVGGVVGVGVGVFIGGSVVITAGADGSVSSGVFSILL